MTIETDIREHQDVEAGKTFCRDCKGGQGLHLASIHKGYGEDAEPLTEDETQLLYEAAEKHDQQTSGQHTISVLIFTRS